MITQDRLQFKKHLPLERLKNGHKLEISIWGKIEQRQLMASVEIELALPFMEDSLVGLVLQVHRKVHLHSSTTPFNQVDVLSTA